MNFEQIEERLYQLTPSEEKYKKQEYFNYKNVYSTIRNGEEDIFQVHLTDISGYFDDGTDFFIRKQSRFAPVPTHVTDVIELNYVYHGNSIHQVNGNQIPLHEGDLILVDTQASHAVDTPGYDDIIISANIRQDYFTDHFLHHLKGKAPLTKFLRQAITYDQSHNQYLIFRKTESQKLHLLFQQLLCEVYDPGIFSDTFKTNYLSLIFLELIRSYTPEGNGTLEDSVKAQLTIQILSYITEHAASTTLQETAAHFGYNTTYFSSLVKSYTGTSFKRLLQETRVAISLPLLTNSTLPIREIAENVGFSSINQYYKIFKEVHHVLPSDYRKNQKVQILDRK